MEQGKVVCIKSQFIDSIPKRILQLEYQTSPIIFQGGIGTIEGHLKCNAIKSNLCLGSYFLCPHW